MTRRRSAGSPEPLGVTPAKGGINVAIFSAHAEAIELCLFDAAGQRETDRIVLPERSGDIFHGHIADVPLGARYGLRAHGPDDPANGHRFNPAKLLVDPHATALDRRFQLHPSQFDHGANKPSDSAPFMPKAIVVEAPPSQPTQPMHTWPDTVIQELHVRGFTKRHPGIPEALRGTFAGLAQAAATDHLRHIGVTTVELLPCVAWIDERHLPPLGLSNYWGYNPVALLAPDPLLAPGGWPEITAAIAALHAAGLEVILDVVLNHTGEGDALGPTLSLRGLDNASYYRLTGTGGYLNDTGCGNTLALDRPQVLRLAMDALRRWADAGLDGFRFDLATTMGRTETGFDPAAPLLQAISQDPALRPLKLIAEPWDIGWGGYQVGNFPPDWAEWNDHFRDDIRRVWRGDPGQLGALATCIAGSADLFGGKRRPSRSLNFITAHDGFSLADLVSHSAKHNQANGEHNRDGTDANYAWNNGAEGPTDDPAILAARRNDQRALLATLLLARGTPMLSMGAELGQSQHGNNNAYAQDNETSWLDWSRADPDLADFVARLTAARRDNPALTDDRFLTGEGDVQWRRADGAIMRPDDWQATDNNTLVALLASDTNRVVLALHTGAAPVTITLPDPSPGRAWRTAIDSAGPGTAAPEDGSVTLAPRSVRLLTEIPRPHRPAGVTSETLATLAEAAGIAPDWWDMRGAHHQVSDDTKHALLAALGLPAATEADARDHLAALRTPHPITIALWQGEPHALSATRPTGVTIQHEDGTTNRLVLPQGAALPLLPIGRYRLHLDDQPDPIALIVAPPACHPPPAQRGFGLAAQLYALRRAGDQGIGDFTALADLARAAPAAAALGINPLHAMFPTDRGRASPYQPSDRRFLDPIYLDVAAYGPSVVPDTQYIDYGAVWTAKQRVLEAAFATLGDPTALDAFIAQGGPSLARFARFQALAELYPHTPWQHWPAAATAPAHRVRFHAFLQFLADRQLADAARAASHMPIGLYRDLAVGAAPDGAETWQRDAEFLRNVTIGAPPDMFSPLGQAWGIPPLNPIALARTGGAAFAELLDANMRHAGALRIDHVMGLERLFCIPERAAATEGAYLHYPRETLLRQLTLESHRNKCLVVGEDLGTVPDGLRERLRDADIQSYRVLWLERDGPAFRPPESYPAQSVACVSTHDLPTLAGWWQGSDIAERETLGLLNPAQAEAETTERETARAALLQALRDAGLSDNINELPASLHAYIAATPAALILVQTDDLASETTAVNLPGTDRERPNWRRRLHPDLADLLATPTARAILASVRAVRP